MIPTTVRASTLDDGLTSRTPHIRCQSPLNSRKLVARSSGPEPATNNIRSDNGRHWPEKNLRSAAGFQTNGIRSWTVNSTWTDSSVVAIENFPQASNDAALMLLRKRRRYVEIAIDGICDGAASWEGWHLTDKSENPEQYYVRKQSAHMLKAAVMRLKSSSRKILELHQTTGLSVKEIARSLGISESAAKARLNRARGQLRASMKP